MLCSVAKLLITLFVLCLQSWANCSILNLKQNQEEPAIANLKEYLRLVAVHPEPDYASSIAWIKNQADEIGLEYNYKELQSPGLFAIWLTWRGTDQSLPSILLNSHIDVVPVDLDRWTHDPFGAEEDEIGNIYARGAQDMKTIAVQYLEAVRNLKTAGITPLRTVHISFVPDEEEGGYKGMQPFVQTDEFKALNVGFALDEGSATTDPTNIFLMWAERSAWRVQFTAVGKSGHGSILHNNTAAEKIQKVINAMLDMRTQEKNRMEANNLTLGEVTTINLTVMKGGEQQNIVPAEMSVIFDVRVTPYWNFTFAEDFLENVRTSAGPEVTLTYIMKSEILSQTPLTPENIWWSAFQFVAEEGDFQLVPQIHSAATDARYLRQIGIPAFGFSTLRNTPRLAHDHDEYVNRDTFLTGIKIYEKLLPQLFNLPAKI